MGENRVIKNAFWIIGVKIAQALLGMVISMMTARYLGPSNFGLINYVSSIVAFVVPITSLGFTGVLVQELIADPKKEGEILGTAIFLSFISALFCILGVIGFVVIVNSGETETLIVCALYSILLLFQSLGMILYWFQSKLLSKYSSIVTLGAYVIMSAYRVYILVTQKSVYWYAISTTIDYMMISLGLYIAYKWLGGKKFSYSIQRAKKLFAKSRYYLVSGMMITVFAQTDRIMLKVMINDAEVGYYAAAVTCAGMTSFVFSAIIDSARPVILELKKIGREKYEKAVICLYSVVIYISLLQSVVFTIFAPLIINTLYGESYAKSIQVLQILVWYCTFSYLGGARDIWILAENKQKHLLVINIVGVILNIGLNYIIIPIYGASGAATASLVTQFVINYVFVLLYKPIRWNGILQIKALNPQKLLYVFTCIRKEK